MKLQVRELRRTFGGVKAVDGVSFGVEQGEILGLIGANGSGKTTTLNLLTRVLPVEAGEMIFDGFNYTNVPTHRIARLGIARTFQNLRLFQDLTVEENLRLGAMVGETRNDKTADGLIAEVVERAGLRELLRAIPSELPYGTQRVVEIARALASRPTLLMLDEPFAGMAVDEAKQIADLLKEDRDSRGTSVVVVDHNMEVLVTLVERMIAMDEGVIIAEGEPNEVLRDSKVVESYVGRDDDD